MAKRQLLRPEDILPLDEEPLERVEEGWLVLPPLIRPLPEERPPEEELPVLRLPPPLFLPIKTSLYIHHSRLYLWR